MRTPRQHYEASLVDYSHRLHAAGWVANHDGNLSVRLDEDRILCTATAISKAEISRAHLIVVDFQGKVISGRYKPFSELNLHLYLYRQRPDVKAVIHAHPPVSTGFAVAGQTILTTMMAEPVVSLGDEIPLVPYARPKSAESTLNMAPFVQDADLLLLEQHGAISYGPDLETAFLRMELGEHLAKIQEVAMRLGGARKIPNSDREALLQSRTKAGLGQAGRPTQNTSLSANGHARSLIRDEVKTALKMER